MRVQLNVVQIVEDRLKADGYDGLCSDDCECACLVGDLAPCGEVQGDCVAGMSETCDITCDHEGYPVDDAWHINPNLEPPAKPLPPQIA